MMAQRAHGIWMWQHRTTAARAAAGEHCAHLIITSATAPMKRKLGQCGCASRIAARWAAFGLAPRHIQSTRISACRRHLHHQERHLHHLSRLPLRWHRLCTTGSGRSTSLSLLVPTAPHIIWYQASNSESSPRCRPRSVQTLAFGTLLALELRPRGIRTTACFILRAPAAVATLLELGLGRRLAMAPISHTSENYNRRLRFRCPQLPRHHLNPVVTCAAQVYLATCYSPSLVTWPRS